MGKCRPLFWVTSQTNFSNMVLMHRDRMEQFLDSEHTKTRCRKSQDLNLVNCYTRPLDISSFAQFAARTSSTNSSVPLPEWSYNTSTSLYNSSAPPSAESSYETTSAESSCQTTRLSAVCISKRTRFLCPRAQCVRG